MDRSCALTQPFKPPDARRKSLYRTPTRVFNLRMTRGVMARVTRTIARITSEGRPGGYRAYTRDELREIISTPVTAADYELADKVARKLVKAQRKLNPIFSPMG